MSVTLPIVFMTLFARQILAFRWYRLKCLSKRADMSIYLKGDTPEETINTIKSRIEN